MEHTVTRLIILFCCLMCWVAYFFGRTELALWVPVLCTIAFVILWMETGDR